MIKKIEVIIFGKEITGKQLQISKSAISSRSTATSLGCILDSKLNISQHVSCVFVNQLTTTYIALGGSANL